MNSVTAYVRSLLPLLLLAASSAAQSHRDLPRFVGERVCLECHGVTPGAAAAPCTLESWEAHRRAYGLLERSEATSIAAISGIGDAPRQSRICLDCHGTAADEGPRWTEPSFDPALGVQCEACHGPGSLHVGVIGQSTATSGTPIADLRIRPGSTVRCVACHMERPSHTYVRERRFRVAAIDDAYKTPVSLAVSNDGARLFVVCQNTNSVVVVNSDSGAIVGEIGVGRRPHGVALSADGARVLVTNRMSGTLSVIDSQSLQVIQSVQVGHDPHGVVVGPAGANVFVLNTGDNTVSVLDAGTFSEKQRLVAGEGPWSAAVATDRARAYLTNVRPQFVPFRSPSHSEVTVVDTSAGVVTQRITVPDANMLQGVAYSTTLGVVLFGMMHTKHLIPATRLQQGWVITNGLGVLTPDGALTQVLLDEPNRSFPDIFDVSISPTGREAVALSGGADEVAIVDIPLLVSFIQSHTEQERATVLPDHLGSSWHFVTRRIDVGSNPRAVAFSPDGRRAYVANALSDTISVIDMQTVAVIRTFALGGPAHTSALRRGARLFHDARHSYGRQFSCRSCHPDGHLNGLSLDIEADGAGILPVDNRTLQGILDTPPFKWEGTNSSLHRQCGPRLAVFFTRLDPFSPDDLDALVHYMCTIERAPNRFRDPRGLTVAQLRGKQVFERSVTNTGRVLSDTERCAGCHMGAYRTDRTRHAVGTTMWFDVYEDLADVDIFDMGEMGWFGSYHFTDVNIPAPEFDTPHLRNVADEAPYLHNGTARSLEELWTRSNMVEKHGVTADLTRQQLNDLIAYLNAQ